MALEAGTLVRSTAGVNHDGLYQRLEIEKFLVNLANVSVVLSLTFDQKEREGKMVAHAENSPVLHIRFDGRSSDIPLSDLDVGAMSKEKEIKRSLATYLDVAENKFRNYVVDRHETGNLTLRPEAVFG